jgi:hypothetical protein
MIGDVTKVTSPVDPNSPINSNVPSIETSNAPAAEQTKNATIEKTSNAPTVEQKNAPTIEQSSNTPIIEQSKNAITIEQTSNVSSIEASKHSAKSMVTPTTKQNANARTIQPATTKTNALSIDNAIDVVFVTALEDIVQEYSVANTLLVNNDVTIIDDHYNDSDEMNEDKSSFLTISSNDTWCQSNALWKSIKICFSEGHLRGTFDRNELAPRKGQTAVMQGIDPTEEGFKRSISVQEAFNSYGSM